MVLYLLTQTWFRLYIDSEVKGGDIKYMVVMLEIQIFLRYDKFIYSSKSKLAVGKNSGEHKTLKVAKTIVLLVWVDSFLW